VISLTARRPRTLLALLLMLATQVFLGGILTERVRSDEQREEPVGIERNHDEAEEGEGSEGRLFGVDADAPALVLLGAGLSLALATLLLWRPSRPVLLLVAGFGLLFALLDAREVVHQLDEACLVVAVLAALAALLHLAVTVLAGQLGRQASPA
jgi:hypothetical protein